MMLQKTTYRMIRLTFILFLLLSCGLLLVPQSAFPFTNMCGVAMDPSFPPEEDETEECEECPEACQKSPCTVAKGNYSTSVVDIQIPTRGFPLKVIRKYKTNRAVDGLLGYGWTSNLLSRLTYATYLYSAPSTYLRMAAIVMPEGGVYEFKENPNGTFSPAPGSHDTLVKNADGTFDLTLKLSRNHYRYSAQGSLIRITDAYGNALSLTYDANGRLNQILDGTGSGRSLALTYDATGHIWSITDHTGRQVQYTITGGKLTSVTDQAHRRTDYSYVQGRFAPLLSQIRDNWGRVITDITYDWGDRVNSYTEAGETWTYIYIYNFSPFQTAKIDSQTNLWIYTSNSAGQVVRTDNPDGNSSLVAYNPDGSVQMSTDETGVKTYFTYNPNGSTASVTRDYQGGMAVRFDYTYDPNFPENITSMIAKNPSNGSVNANWQGSKFDYYQAGSVAPGALFHKYRVRSDGVTLDTLETYTYNAAGQVLTATSATGGVTTYTYDANNGDLISIRYPKNSSSGANPVYTYGRDSLGRVASITNPSGKITFFTYDSVDRVISITVPKPSSSSTLSFVTNHTYDNYDASSGLVFIHKIDPNGKMTRKGFDAYDQLVQTIDAQNQTTTFTYANGLLSQIIDANGNATTYGYDALRRLSGTQFPDNMAESYVYFPDGKLQAKTDRHSQTVSYQYDRLKRLTQKVYPNSSSITYTFAGQKLTTVNDTSAGETHSFTYDSSYRMSSNTQGTRGTLNFTYDAADRVLTYSISGGPSTSHTYYADGSLKTITWSAVTGTFQYTHTLNGQYNSITFPNAQHRDFSYDDQGRLLQVANIHPGTGNLATYSYGYDYNHSNGSFTMLGQRTSQTANVPSQGFTNHQSRYYYDNNYQLTRVDYPNVAPLNGEVDRWTYDPIGNRLTNTVNGSTQNYTYVPNPQNSNNTQRLESDGVNGYSYDENGNLVTKSGPGGTFYYNYDYDNRLTAITGAATASYKYDYMGRRTSKSSGGTTTFLYNGFNLIAERGPSVADYVFGPSIDEPLAMKRGTSVYYYDTDALGSATLVNGTSGTVSNKYVFDAWGQTRTQTAAVANPFTYTSRESSDAGLLFYRARYYNPAVGRFHSEDPLAELSISLYTQRQIEQPTFYPDYLYTNNMPILFKDPLGFDKCQDCWDDWYTRQKRCGRDQGLGLALCSATLGLCFLGPEACLPPLLICSAGVLGKHYFCSTDAKEDRVTCLRRCNCNLVY